MGRGKTGNFWKAAAILLGCALLTGCGNTGEVDDYATNIGYEARGSNGTTQVVQSESGSSATTQTAGIPKEEIKVGVLHLSDPAEGSGYTYTHDLGIQGMQQNLGLSDDHNYFGRIYQARYLSGIVAGMNTSSNKIGYVAAMDSSNSEVTGGIDAFALGIYSVNPDAKVYVKVTNSWYDPEGEKAAAQTLLDMGCDVIAQHCDTVYPQTLAQEKGVYSIGYNSDMSKDAPQSCLCSVVWNWSAYYTAAVQSVIDGSWDGSNYYGGMNENLVSITDLADFCAEGTKEKVEEAKKQILSGENGVFDGGIETNTGETVGKEGTTLDDATITGGINWYFKTVSVVE